MVVVKVFPTGKPPSFARSLPLDVSIPGKTLKTATVEDVKNALAKKIPKFYPSRQKLTVRYGRDALDDETTLHDAGIGEEETEMSVKDLGPQISWRTVFLVEYAGPLVIHPLIYHQPDLFFGRSVLHSELQKYVYIMVLLHFFKRELETIFVHRFSHATMPAKNIFKNSAHYHLLSGVLLAYSVYSPTYSATSPYIIGSWRDDPKWLLVGSAIWALCELANLANHITLRNLRPPGTKTRAIPYGFGFSLVSCPNYFFEGLTWVVISVLTGSWSAWLFTVVAVGQMALWALKKHRAYRREFGREYPRKRKVMVPFIF